MARCEDYPCCGHVGDEGPCPNYDESGKQTNMICTCGAEVHITSQYSICSGCLNRSEDGDEDYGDREFERYGYDGEEDY